MKQLRRSKALKRKVTSPRPKAAQEPTTLTERPTPELASRVKFELGQVITETGQPFGFAYRRRPIFESIRELSPDELAALRFYRTTFDRSERSPVRSCLNVAEGGRGMSGANALFHATPAMIDAKRKLAACEGKLGPYRDTMRAVTLDDKSFSQIAIERFGSRTKPAPKPGEPVKIVPRSGRHRERIRNEFVAGLKILTDEIRGMVTTGGVEEVWVKPLDDGTAVIRRSMAAPACRYRCWGDNVLVDRVMSELRKRFGSALEFRNAGDAIRALKEVEDGRLRHLEPEELAA